MKIIKNSAFFISNQINLRKNNYNLQINKIIYKK